MTPLELGAVLLQFSVFLIAGLPIGALIAGALGDLRRRVDADHMHLLEHRFGAPERILFTIIGAVAWSACLMILHVVSGGFVLRSPVVVPLATVALLLWDRRRRSRDRRAPFVDVRDLVRSVDRRAVVVAVVVLIALYVVPMVVAGSSVRTGDSPWHLGWTEQLLAGERVPTGPAPGFAHNSYPWGIHAVLATMVRLVPGSSPLLALAALHLVLVLGLPLGAAVLARRIVPAAGWAAAAATSLIGGFGWMAFRSADFSTSPSGGRAGADLVVASPNSVYELLPPALPRELGLILLAGAGTCLSAWAGSARRAAVVSGAVVGLVGLVSVPMFVSALVWMIAAWMASRDRRPADLFYLALPAAIVFGLWAAPVVVDYVRLGGFVDITPRLGREWSLVEALASWGLLLPLAAGGLLLVMRQHRQRARSVVAFAIGTAILLGLSMARGAFDWDLYGNATVLHQGRVWPPAHLLAGVSAGIALLHGYGWLRRKSDRLARAAVASILVAGGISPVIASIDLTDTMAGGRSGFIYDEASIVDEDSFVQRAAAQLGPDDVVTVQGSDELAFLLFQFSGVRLADYDNPNLPSNDLRIRFRDAARGWQQVADADGFEATHVVMPAAGSPTPSTLAVGSYGGDRWALVRTQPEG